MTDAAVVLLDPRWGDWEHGAVGVRPVTPEVSPVCLGAEHAVELCELLEFMGGLLDHAPDGLGDAVAIFCGGGYTVEDLRADLDRFAFLLGGDGARFVVGDDR